MGLRIDRKKVIMKDGFPKHYEVLPHLAEVAIDTTRRAFQFAHSILFNTNVQFCQSDHYVREHFTDEPIQPPQGLPPATRWIEE